MLACRKKSRAEVVDGSLIVSLPDAEKPCVWKMDMSRVHSAALEVREENGLYILGVKGARGDVADIAPFAQKKKADAALVSITRALMKKKDRKWLKIVVAVLLVFLLLSLFSGNGGNRNGVVSSGSLERGKPLPAEQVFGN